MKLRNILISAMAGTALATVPAQAQESVEPVSAHSLIHTDIEGEGTAFAIVDDFVLSSDGSEIEFVLFEMKEGVATEAQSLSFVPWTNVDINSNGLERDLMIVGNENSGPQELSMTRAEANTRILSRILDSDLVFADGVVRPIDDIIFDPQSGEVDDYIVAFEDDDRRVPAEFVSVSPSDGYSVVQPSDYTYTVYVIG